MNKTTEPNQSLQTISCSVTVAAKPLCVPPHEMSDLKRSAKMKKIILITIFFSWAVSALADTYVTITAPFVIKFKDGEARLPIGTKLKSLGKNDDVVFVVFSGSNCTVPIKFTDLSKQPGIRREKSGDFWVYKDPSDKILIEGNFIYAGDFEDGLAKVWRSDGYGFIDPNGKFMKDKPQFRLQRPESKFGEIESQLSIAQAITKTSDKEVEDGINYYVLFMKERWEASRPYVAPPENIAYWRRQAKLQALEAMEAKCQNIGTGSPEKKPNQPLQTMTMTVPVAAEPLCGPAIVMSDR